MMTAEKTEIRHNDHVNLDPALYAYVGWTYQGSSVEVWESIDGYDREFLGSSDIEAMNITDGHWKTKGTCDHCGAHFAWGAVFKCSVNDDIVVVGHTCAGDKFHLPSKCASDRRLVSKGAKAKRFAKKQAERAVQLLADNPGLGVLLGKDADPKHYILADLKSKLWSMGKLSEAQIALAFKLQAQVERDALQPKMDVPSGRQEVEGTIMSVKSKPNPYQYNGVIWQMLVKDFRGFKVWGTVPSSLCLYRPAKGRIVRFTATLEQSDKDPDFGFYKRPSKAQFNDWYCIGNWSRS